MRAEQQPTFGELLLVVYRVLDLLHRPGAATRTLIPAAASASRFRSSANEAQTSFPALTLFLYSQSHGGNRLFLIIAGWVAVVVLHRWRRVPQEDQDMVLRRRHLQPNSASLVKTSVIEGPVTQAQC